MLERWRLGLGSSESGGNRRADRRGSLQRGRFDRWHPRTSGRSFSTGASAASAGFATPRSTSRTSTVLSWELKPSPTTRV